MATTKLTPGDKAPAIKLLDQDGETVTLAKYKGRKVLVPVDKIAYVDLGQEHVRPVGFGTL